MSGEIRTRLVIDLAGNLESRARRFGQSFQRLERSGTRSMKALGRAAAAASRMIDRLGNRYTALATGAAGVGTVRFLVGLEKRFTMLGVQANISAGEVDALKKRIFEVSQQKDIRIDPGQLTAAVEKIVEKTGDLGFAMENIDNIARAIGGTGGEGGTIGALTAEFRKFGITSKDEVAQALDILVTQGKNGSFTVADLATQGERLAAAYAATGRSGMDAVRELGAVIQVIKDGVGPPEQAATAFEALLRTLNDADKVKTLQGNGIRIFEPGQPDVMRSVADIMRDIVVATKGDQLKISEVFDSEAMRAFNASVGEFKKTGALDRLDGFLKMQADGNALLNDSATNAKTAAAAMQNLYTAWQQFADSNLTAPIQQMADILNALDPDQVQTLFKGAAGVVAAGGALWLGKKGMQLGAGIAGMFGKRGGALGAMAGAAGGVTPVYVVNMPMGGMGGGFGGFGGRAGRMARAGRLGFLGRMAARGSSLLGGLGKLAGRAAMPLMLATTGMQLYDSIGRGDTGGVGGALGGLGGGLGGAAAGAAIGSVIPGIGTVIGGIAGGILGSLGGEGLGELIGKQFGGDGTGAVAGKVGNLDQVRPEGKITVELTGPGAGGARVKEITARGVDIDVDTGPLLSW